MTTLFIVNYDCGLELYSDVICKKIYNDLESAKQYLKHLYNTTVDYKHSGYNIMEYSLENNEYIFTNIIYKYNYRTDMLDRYQST